MNIATAQSDYSCSGCGACLTVCSCDAIHLSLNARGFYQASVDNSKCVDCGRCIHTCTRFDKVVDGRDIRASSCFAMQSSDAETVRRSSSGGIAHEIAAWALQQGYLLCGAVYDLTTDRVRHVITEDISLLDGSKYLQSDTSVFAELIAKARNGQRFAVFGVPCQIAGLAKAAELKECRDKLLLVEVFCHGVPTYHLWARECENVRKKLRCGRFDSVQFRDKKNGWHSYCLRFEANGKVYYGTRERDFFYRVFFEDVLLNDSCINCRMRKEQSFADIRLGDYWGKRYQGRNDGVSVVFCNTSFGEEVIQQLSIRKFETGNAEEILSCQNMAGYTERSHHQETMKILEKEGLDTAIGFYRFKMSGRQKLRRFAISMVGLLPYKMRAAIRRMR